MKSPVYPHYPFSSYLALLGLCFFTRFTLTAQHYQHNTFWFRAAVLTAINKQWDFSGDYVHRQQNDARISKINPFQRESLDELRLWAILKKKYVSFLFNPVTYMYSKPLLGKAADYEAAANYEIRFAVGAEARQTRSKWNFRERAQYEYRIQKSDNYRASGRIRLRNTLQYALSAKNSLAFFNEVFLNTGPNPKPNFFDQTWNMLSFGRQLTSKMKLDVGIMRNLRERRSLTEFDDENALNLAFTFKF